MNEKIISRKKAKEQGIKWYFTGKPCPKGHVCRRSVATYQCKECVKLVNTQFSADNPDYKKQYYYDNKTDCLTYTKQWQQDNPDKRQKSIKKYVDKHGGYSVIGKQQRKENPEIGQKSSKKWRAHNPHKVAESAKLRRTALEQAIPIWYEEELVKQLYLKRDELNKLWGINLEVDHIIPLKPRCGTVQGLHCWHNLQLLDRSLNGTKHDKYNTDW